MQMRAARICEGESAMPNWTEGSGCTDGKRVFPATSCLADTSVHSSQ